MKYLFILGRNTELSKLEIFSFLKKTQNPVKNFFLEKNGLLVEVENSIDGKTIDFLGGTISIGEIISEGNFKSLTSELENKSIYMGTKNNITFALWDFCKEETSSKILDYLKKRFRSEKLRASQKPLSGIIQSQDEQEFSILSSKLVDLEFFVFETKDKIFFGEITQKCDYSSLELRDMKKPVRREALSISPRLAKIMINLSGAFKEQTLVDPFCGIGVILQEALLQNISVIGVDFDKTAVDGARQNLAWLNFPKENYQLLRNDSTQIKIREVEVLVAEPDFGPILKKSPTPEQSREIMQNFEDLLISVLNNLKPSVKNTYVFTAPCVKLHNKKRASCNIQKILDSTQLKLVEGFPVKEFRESQIVGREIFVLER
jgi:tRNA G10  N-methylase Trm11